MQDHTSSTPSIQTKEIPLTQGKVAIVDAADYEWLSQWKWCALNRKHTFYAVRCVRVQGKSRLIYMHREILGVESGTHVDHRDRDGLNNARNNIRPCTQRQNNFNVPPRKNRSSKYKGVSWNKFLGKWRVLITVNGKTERLGHYDNQEDAARAYDVAARELHGEFAYLNFGEGNNG